MHRRTKATPHLFASGAQVRYRNRREPRDGPAAHDSSQTNQLGIEIRNPCDRQIACLVVGNEINQRLCGWQFECLVAVMPCPDKEFGAQRTNAARRALRNEYRAEALENG